MYRWEITRAALAQRVVAIVRGDTYEQTTTLADTLLTAGVEALEISLTSPFALDTIGMLRRETGADAVIGAGTVLDAASARAALDAGARFLVSPGLDADVIRTGHRHGVPVFPGVATPTEMIQALELGADALKLFPASGRSPAWLRDVRAALPQAPLVPTGGVTVEAAPEWIAAGAVACGMGSALADADRETTAKRVTELLQRLEEAAAPQGGGRAGRTYGDPSGAGAGAASGDGSGDGGGAGAASGAVPSRSRSEANASKPSETSSTSPTSSTSTTSKTAKSPKNAAMSKAPPATAGSAGSAGSVKPVSSAKSTKSTKTSGTSGTSRTPKDGKGRSVPAQNRGSGPGRKKDP